MQEVMGQNALRAVSPRTTLHPDSLAGQPSGARSTLTSNRRASASALPGDYLGDFTNRRAPKLLAVVPAGESSEAIQRLAKGKSWNLAHAETADAGLRQFRASPCSIVVLDIRLTSIFWQLTLRSFLETAPDCCVIMLVPVATESFWEHYLQVGGYDLVTEPIDPTSLSEKIESAWTYSKRFCAPGAA